MRNVNSRSTSFNRVASVFASSDNRTKFVRVFVDRSVLDVIVVISNKIETAENCAGGNNPPACCMLSCFNIISIHCFRIYHNLDKINLTTIVETTIVETGVRRELGGAGLHPGTAAAAASSSGAAAAAASSSGAAAAAASSSGQQHNNNFHKIP